MTRTERKLLFKKCGEQRKLKRPEIRAALILAEKSEADIARSLGVSNAAICRTIAGVTHATYILDALIEAGVSPDLLSDPREAIENAR